MGLSLFPYWGHTQQPNKTFPNFQLILLLCKLFYKSIILSTPLPPQSGCLINSSMWRRKNKLLKKLESGNVIAIVLFRFWKNQIENSVIIIKQYSVGHVFRSFHFLKKFLMFIFERQRKTEREEGGAERGRHRIWGRLQVLSCQHRDWHEA